jgi:hypothetical protein
MRHGVEKSIQHPVDSAVLRFTARLMPAMSLKRLSFHPSLRARVRPPAHMV